MIVKEFRNNGAVGALLDEYEKAVIELKSILSDISSTELNAKVKSKIDDPNFKSIQSILSHVIRAGNWYNIEIRKSLGENLENPELHSYDKINDYQEKLTQMFESTEIIFNEYKNVDLYQERKFRWQHIFNIDNLLEHAIVHVLRHRRQIERFLLELKSQLN